MPLYHPDVYLPEGLVLPVKLRLRPTRHARQEAAKDGLSIPRRLSTRRARLFEVKLDENGRFVKLGYRVRHDRWRDLCLVVAYDPPIWTVVTVWSNDVNDHHYTLDHTRYHREMA